MFRRPRAGCRHACPVDLGCASAYQGYQIIRRNGAVVVFEPAKISVALMKAFLAVHGTQGAASASVRETVDGLTRAVVRAAALARAAAPSTSRTCGIRSSSA